MADTELLAKAREIVVGHQRGSISLIQRLLKIRYSEADHLLVELERQGVVGPIRGNGGREVLVMPWPVERRTDPGQRWKLGDEFLPFHPSASHVPPEYRDGWNRCYWMAAARSAPPSDGGQQEDVSVEWVHPCKGFGGKLLHVPMNEQCDRCGESAEGQGNE